MSQEWQLEADFFSAHMCFEIIISVMASHQRYISKQGFSSPRQVPVQQREQLTSVAIRGLQIPVLKLRIQYCTMSSLKDATNRRAYSSNPDQYIATDGTSTTGKSI